MEWAEMMVRRDRLVRGLLPSLGERQARQRADHIVQTVLFTDEPEPERLVHRMLLRDLGRADAASLAASVAGPWRSGNASREPLAASTGRSAAAPVVDLAADRAPAPGTASAAEPAAEPATAPAAEPAREYTLTPGVVRPRTDARVRRARRETRMLGLFS